MTGTALLLTLAMVLGGAAVAKLRQAVRPEPVAELLLAAVVLVAPGRVAGIALAVVFAVFAVTHVRRWHAGEAGCDCFGADSGAGVSAARSVALTAASAAAALAVALAGSSSVVGLLRTDPASGAFAAVVAVIAGAVWRALFSLRPGQADRLAGALVRGSALALERRFTRRTALQQIALVGSALAVAPLRYMLYPGSAMAAIRPSDCARGLCTDGWTEFCCQINRGANSCPEGTFAGGWWMCTDYRGTQLCGAQGVRYYVDCNALPGREYPGGCQCARGSCDQRRVACNIFRYGQCNTHVPGVTAVVCRMVMCENPSTVSGLGCSASLAVDNVVCHQDAPCLIPDALELAGAGGV